MYRLTAATATPAAARTSPGGGLAILVALVLLAAGGFGAYGAIKPATFHDGRYAIAFWYNSADAAAIGADRGSNVTQAAFTSRGSAGLPRIFSGHTANGGTILVQAQVGPTPIDQIDPQRFVRNAEPMGLTMSDVMVGGRKAVRLRYAYLVSRRTDRAISRACVGRHGRRAGRQAHLRVFLRSRARRVQPRRSRLRRAALVGDVAELTPAKGESLTMPSQPRRVAILIALALVSAPLVSTRLVSAPMGAQPDQGAGQ